MHFGLNIVKEENCNMPFDENLHSRIIQVQHVLAAPEWYSLNKEGKQYVVQSIKEEIAIKIAKKMLDKKLVLFETKGFEKEEFDKTIIAYASVRKLRIKN